MKRANSKVANLCGSALPGAIPPASSQLIAPRRALPRKPVKPHESALRHGRWSQTNHCYFITANAAGKQSIFESPGTAQIIIDSLCWLQEQGRIRLMGFVVMPDHVHVAFVLGEDKGGSRPEGRSHKEGGSHSAPSLARVMDSFKGYTGKKINELLGRHGEVWQPAYYDHRVREEKEFRALLEYMHANPVRKELVCFAEEYEYSSANEKYQGLVDWEWMLGVELIAPGRALPQQSR